MRFSSSLCLPSKPCPGSIQVCLADQSFALLQPGNTTTGWPRPGPDAHGLPGPGTGPATAGHPRGVRCPPSVTVSPPCPPAPNMVYCACPLKGDTGCGSSQPGYPRGEGPPTESLPTTSRRRSSLPPGMTIYGEDTMIDRVRVRWPFVRGQRPLANARAGHDPRARLDPAHSGSHRATSDSPLASTPPQGL
jgi:hypothetical protein